MEDLVICRPSEEDIAAACEISVEVYIPIREVFRKEMTDELYEAFFDGWQDKKRASVAAELRERTGYVTKLNGEVVGFISYIVHGDKGEIRNNAVANAHRGKGIGGMQYEFVFQKMREEGAQYATVFTGGDDGHAPARRAYEKAGFEAFLPHRTYYKKL